MKLAPAKNENCLSEDTARIFHERCGLTGLKSGVPATEVVKESAVAPDEYSGTRNCSDATDAGQREAVLEKDPIPSKGLFNECPAKVPRINIECTERQVQW